MYRFWARLGANTDHLVGPKGPSVASSEYPHMCEVTAGVGMCSELDHLSA